MIGRRRYPELAGGPNLSNQVSPVGRRADRVVRAPPQLPRRWYRSMRLCWAWSGSLDLHRTAAKT